MRNQKYWKKCMALMLSASMILPSASVVMAEDMAAEFVSQETMVEESDETDAASQEMVETEQEQDVQEQPEEAFGDMDSVEEPVEAEADADAEKIAYTVNYYNADRYRKRPDSRRQEQHRQNGHSRRHSCCHRQLCR